LTYFHSVSFNAAQRPCMRCVPPYISHYQNSAFCVSVQVPEKLSKELITIKDAEPARSSKVNEAPGRTSTPS